MYANNLFPSQGAGALTIGEKWEHPNAEENN